jgi:hypothetical protein
MGVRAFHRSLAPRQSEKVRFAFDFHFQAKSEAM